MNHDIKHCGRTITKLAQHNTMAVQHTEQERAAKAVEGFKGTGQGVDMGRYMSRGKTPDAVARKQGGC